jgi:hypothetical protein
MPRLTHHLNVAHNIRPMVSLRAVRRLHETVLKTRSVELCDKRLVAVLFFFFLYGKFATGGRPVAGTAFCQSLYVCRQSPYMASTKVPQGHFFAPAVPSRGARAFQGRVLTPIPPLTPSLPRRACRYILQRRTPPSSYPLPFSLQQTGASKKKKKKKGALLLFYLLPHIQG